MKCSKATSLAAALTEDSKQSYFLQNVQNVKPLTDMCSPSLILFRGAGFAVDTVRDHLQKKSKWKVPYPNHSNQSLATKTQLNQNPKRKNILPHVQKLRHSKCQARRQAAPHNPERLEEQSKFHRLALGSPA